MILHNFECSSGHIFEAMIPSTSIGKKITCQFKDLKGNKLCKKKASIIYLPPRLARAARNFAPCLLYTNQKGEVFNPLSPDAPLTKRLEKHLKKRGFTPTHINTFRDYEKFQRSQSSIQRDKSDAINYLEQQDYNQSIKKGFEELKAGGTIELTDEKGRLRKVKYPPLDQMHPSIRRLAEYAMERNGDFRFKTEDTNPFIAAFENDGLRQGKS